MKFISYLVMTIFFFPIVLEGKHLPPYLKFKRINELNGLQVDMVNDIKQGPLGFIWLATNDGLYRYDGQKFIIYRYENDNPGSLPNNFVSRLFFDSKKNFWVLTDEGTAQYNYSTNSFDQIINKSDNSISMYHNISDITEANDGTFYISTYGDGVKCYKNGKLYPLSDKTDAPAINKLIMTILLQHDTILWIGSSDNGLQKYNLSSKKLINYTYPENDDVNAGTIYSLYKDSKENIWVGTNNGLVVFPEDSKPFQIKKGERSNLSDNKIFSILEDHSHRIWIGTGESGLMTAPTEQILIQKEKSVFTIYEASEELNTISYRSINCIFQDKSDNIWLGTYHDGLNVFLPDGEKVSCYRHYANQSNSLPHNRVWGICEDHEGNLWIGTDGNGISKLDPFTGKFNHFPFQNGQPSGPNDKAILSAICDRNNNLWFGTYLGGVSFFDQQTQKFKHFYKNNVNNVFAQNDIRSLHETPDGTIWAGTNRGGLYYFDKTIHNFIAVDQNRELDIRAITSDINGILWIGTYGNSGLYSYNPTTKEFIGYTLQDEVINAMPVIFSLCFTSDSVLWLGSRYFGLIRFNVKTYEKKYYTTMNGLAHNTIKAIVRENKNMIWLSTDMGISSFNTESEVFDNYSVADGLLPGLFNDNSAFKSSNGYLVFGCHNGLNIFYPKNLQKPDMPPSIVLTDFKLFNKSLKVDPKIKNNPITKSIWIEDTIRLKHDQNVFTLDFVAQNYPFSEGWNYEFILENYDENWNNVKEQNNCTYRNLPPGEYMFRVRAVDKSNKVHGNERSILIFIKPPWWKTIWTYSVIFIILVSIIWLVILYRIEQIKLKNSLYYEKKMRQQEHKLTQEKLRFYTNFSHELRTPLSLILGISNDLSNENPRYDQQSKIDIIRRNTKYLLEIFNKLLEFRKIESNKIILNISKSSINALIRQEVEFFEFQAKQKNIVLASEIEGDHEGWADFNSLQIIINNLLSNAIKFTPSDGNISLKSKNENKILNIQVSNTGKSLSDKEKKSIFIPFFQGENSAGHGGTGIGLALCKNLVKLHKGTILVKNDPGTDTTFVINIPVSKENYMDIKHARFIKEPVQYTNTFQKPITKNLNNTDTPDENDKLVLLVDDNYDIIEYLYNILNSEYKIISADNGKTGIELATNQIPDLIISDVMMPQKSGIELCHELKSNIKTSHIPIILLTAKDTKNAKIEGYAKGADDYIVKPFDSMVLKSRINSLFQNRVKLRNYFKSDYKPGKPDDRISQEEEFLSELESCILQMYENDTEISVPELCKKMGFSRTSLYRKIKAISDLSINQIIRSVKLRKSAELLKQNKLTISEISFEIGFNDVKYFRKSFKDQFGMVPSKYRSLYIK